MVDFVDATQIAQMCGLPKFTMQDIIKKSSTFPAPVALPTRKRRWIKADVEQWMESMSTFGKKSSKEFYDENRKNYTGGRRGRKPATEDAE